MDENQRIRESVKNLSFSQKLEHVWFYYKWFIIFGIIVLVFALVCVSQCSGKTEPDATVMYAGPESVSSAYVDYVTSAFSSIMTEDYNGDGKKNVEFIQINLATDEENAAVSDALQDVSGDDTQQMLFYNQNASGTAVIYLIDEKIYPSMSEFLTPLDEVLDEVPQYALDEYGIRISDLPCYKTTDLKYLPSNAILCLRSKTKLRVLNPFDNDYYAANAELFRTLVTEQDAEPSSGKIDETDGEADTQNRNDTANSGNADGEA